MEDLLDIAKYIYDNSGFPSDKKVQKLVYYAYSWYIVVNNQKEQNIENRLVKQRPEAWIHGPVFHELFEYMTYKRESFMQREINLTENTKRFLNTIIELYGRYTGNQLEDMTHNELPWQEARGNLPANERSRNLIRDDTIFSYYNS